MVVVATAFALAVFAFLFCAFCVAANNVKALGAFTGATSLVAMVFVAVFAAMFFVAVFTFAILLTFGLLVMPPVAAPVSPVHAAMLTRVKH
jgi:hypothetical protein